MEVLGEAWASGAAQGWADGVAVCAPRSPGGWRMLASMVAFVLLAWAFAPSTRLEGKSRGSRAEGRSRRDFRKRP